MITLYIKKHNKTGLLYLGKTNKKDPHKYRGSGKRWLAELQKYGADYSTIVIEQVPIEFLRDRGKYWSNYYHVTTAMDNYGNAIWANLIPESGGGPGHRHNKETYENMASKLRGTKRPNVSKSIEESWKNPERKIKQTNATSGCKHYSKKDGYVNKRLGKKYPGGNSKLSGENNPSKRPEVREKMRKPHGPKPLLQGKNHYTANPNYISKISGDQHYTKNPDFLIKSNNKNYDHNIYSWQHEETLEMLNTTRRNFLKITKSNPGTVSDIINGKAKNLKIKKWKFLGKI